MEGNFSEGWYQHPSLGLIKIFFNNSDWVYVCYTRNGQKALSKERKIDNWIWALSKPADRH
ncbi:MAG: hypothetical protein EYX74_06915 [Desulfobulbaceae bacterium]|nr:MAG: hypothetical protein EYX74_06915 [Desulfobulbaceae bacterium]